MDRRERLIEIGMILMNRPREFVLELCTIEDLEEVYSEFIDYTDEELLAMMKKYSEINDRPEYDPGLISCI